MNTKMRDRDLVLSVIAAAGGREDLGRTALQKAVFFTGLVLDRPTGHTPYYYGPYSSVVEDDTAALVLTGLVEETRKTTGVNRKGYLVTRYKYAVTASGQERLSRLTDKYPDEVNKVNQFMGTLLDVFGNLDQATLAAAAKTLYIAREQGSAVTADDISALAQDYGWELNSARINDVAELLKKLQFVRVQDD